MAKWYAKLWYCSSFSWEKCNIFHICLIFQSIRIFVKAGRQLLWSMADHLFQLIFHFRKCPTARLNVYWVTRAKEWIPYHQTRPWKHLLHKRREGLKFVSLLCNWTNLKRYKTIAHHLPMYQLRTIQTLPFVYIYANWYLNAYFWIYLIQIVTMPSVW